jgi:hypothetical protein
MSIKNIPNPVESNVVFEFTLTDEANAEIQIYTSTGELVAKHWKWKLFCWNSQN